MSDEHECQSNEDGDYDGAQDETENAVPKEPPSYIHETAHTLMPHNFFLYKIEEIADLLKLSLPNFRLLGLHPRTTHTAA